MIKPKYSSGNKNILVLDELNETFDAVDLNTVRCLILTGAGEKSFVAGADIGEMSTLSKAEGEAFGKKGNDIFRKIEQFPVPVIAAASPANTFQECIIQYSILRSIR